MNKMLLFLDKMLMPIFPTNHAVDWGSDAEITVVSMKRSFLTGVVYMITTIKK